MLSYFGTCLFPLLCLPIAPKTKNKSLSIANKALLTWLLPLITASSSAQSSFLPQGLCHCFFLSFTLSFHTTPPQQFLQDSTSKKQSLTPRDAKSPSYLPPILNLYLQFGPTLIIVLTVFKYVITCFIQIVQLVQKRY